MKLVKRIFAELKNQTIFAYNFKNDNGMEVELLNYGGIITKIIVPDREGKLENVVLGFDTIDEYFQRSPYFGAIVGRVAGRIKDGEFTLNGVSYNLAKNNGNNHLHGGIKGFDKVIWDAHVIEHEDRLSVELSYVSNDKEEGYPGTLHMKVTYTLTNKNELYVCYEGVSDQRTLLNVTNHSYFNLSGNLKRDILNHVLTLKSDRMVELNEELLPTGEICPVKGTAFDFSIGRAIKSGYESKHPQNILAGNGYDHPFILSEHFNKEVELKDEESGRVLIVETDQPAVVLYTGSQLSDNYVIRDVQSRKYLGLCLETQGLPDAIHHPQFPSIIIEKDELYQSTTKYTFSITQ
ncbi:galactose mutarotase [Bacillus sp. HMF5848]|uniref:aldose epimerase family protein n=1 Tax=Bacillus sp. HMF5848 TaxID=2495421 RepID=UPI000F7705FD|nr:aldose epimerase family protein [Bacillus sp. HMF5848]RSK26183.1 galactose mutarotase [Bacillus sp. HMF5848]